MSLHVEALLLPLFSKLNEENILRFTEFLPIFLRSDQQKIIEIWHDLHPLICRNESRQLNAALARLQPDTTKVLQNALLSYFDFMKRRKAVTSNNRAEVELQNARLLIDMDEYERALPLLEKAKEWAQRYDLQLLMLNALALETRIYTRLQNFEKLSQIGKMEWKAHRKLQNLRAYTHLASQIFKLSYKYGKALSPEIKAEISRHTKSSLLTKEAKALSPRAAIQHNACKSYLYNLSGQDDKGILYQERILEIYEQQPDLLRLAPAGYIAAASNLIAALISVRRYERALQNLDELQNLKKRYQLNAGGYDSASLFFNVLLNRATIYKLQGKLDLFRQVCEQLDAGLSQFEGHVKHQNLLEAQSLIAECCLVYNDYVCAETRCRQMLAAEDKSVMQTQFVNAHLMLLVALVEQQNWRKAEVGIKELSAYFESNNRYVKMEVMMLEILRRFVRERENDLEAICREYLRVLEKSGDESEFYGTFNTDDYFDITRWLHARLNKAERAAQKDLPASRETATLPPQSSVKTSF